jgi:GDPmannose 4,6-dehydratase
MSAESATKRRAFISGITGQDGSHLAELLLSKGYDVHGLVRHTSRGDAALINIEHLLPRLTLHRGNMMDACSLVTALRGCSPHEVYNNADQDSVDWSFAVPSEAMEVTYKGVANLITAVRYCCGYDVRMYQPISATVYGASNGPQDEDTSIHPQSPYACAKAAALHLCRYYRDCHGLKVSCGILYNHLSERRSREYLLPRLVDRALDIADGVADTMPVGDPDAGRFDVGWAPEYVEASWRMLQREEASDYVIGTGTAWSIREIAYHCLAAAGIENDREEYDRYSCLLTSDRQFKRRPGKPEHLLANPAKAKHVLGWEARTTLPDIIRRLVEHRREQRRLQRGPQGLHSENHTTPQCQPSQGGAA